MQVNSRRRQRRIGRPPSGPLDPSVGRRLRELRAARGLTQDQLAGEEFTKGYVSLIETGRTGVSVRAAEVFAARLGVSPSDLVSAAASASQAKLELVLLRAEQLITSGDWRAAGDLLARTDRMPIGKLRARGLRLRGLVLVASGRAREAIRDLDEALRAFRTVGQREMVVRTLFDLARAHARLDRPTDAINFALDCERRLNSGELVDRTLELQVLQFLASAFLRIGDFDAADARAERALALAEDISDPNTLARLYAGLSLTRQQQGDLEAALLYARRSLEQFERVRQEREVAETWNTVAWLYVSRGQYDKAREALERADRMAAELALGPLQALILTTKAELAMATEDFDEAVRIAAQCIEHPAVTPYGSTTAALIRARAIARQKRTLREMRDAFEQAVEAFREQPRRRRADVHEAYSRALADRGEAEQALTQAQKALELLKPAKL